MQLTTWRFMRAVSNRSQTGLKQVDPNFEILRKTLAYLTNFDEICTKVVNNGDSVFYSQHNYNKSMTYLNLSLTIY